MANEPITREEILLNAVATGETSNLEPITREEMFLAKAGGQDVQTPTPITRKEMFLQAVVDNAGGGGDGDRQLDALIDGSITEIRSEVTKIRDYSFQGVSTLETATFPNAEVVGEYSFYGCKSLASIDCHKIRQSKSRAFSETAIKKAIFPLLANVGTYTFSNCAELQEIDCPVLTGAKDSFCNKCTALTRVNLPLVSSLGTRAFEGCTSLEQISLPSAKSSIPNNCFYGCTNLKTAKLGNANATFSINSKVFYNCSAFTTLVMPSNVDGTRIANLVNVDAFYGTPFADGGTGGTVYVPAELIEQYQQATNWSTLYAAGTCNFVAIEGSEYE